MLHSSSHPSSARDLAKHSGGGGLSSQVYTYARDNRSSRAKVDTETLYAQGAFKYVYLGVYTEGPRHGQRCVVKVMKDDANLSQALDIELEINRKTQQIIDAFNAQNIIDKKILLNRPEVWEWEEDMDNAGTMCIAEPIIHPCAISPSSTAHSHALSKARRHPDSTAPRTCTSPSGVSS